MQDEGKGKESGVKRIKSKRDAALQALCLGEVRLGKLEQLSRRGNGRNLETTMTSEEVSSDVEVSKQYNQVKGNKPRKPYKILRQVTGREVDRYYVCLYHDVGYTGQDYQDTHPEDYLKPISWVY